MGSEWPRVSLSDLGVKLIDCDHKTPKAVDFGVPYIGIPQMDNGRINFDAKPRLISEDDFVTWTRKANPMFGDIILSRRCNSGETVYVPDNTKFALGQNLVLLRPTGDALHPEYLRWAVQGRDWWNEVSRYLNPGAIFESLKCVDIPKFKIPAPPKEQQVKISIILQALTDKIELNRQINQTLEQMAQTLFKSWFVDFDPVIDNALDAIANGQNIEIPESLEKRFEARKAVRESEGFEPLPADIRQLFPCEFEESELSVGINGFVPKGWGVCSMSELVDIASSKRVFAKDYVDSGVPFFRGKEITELSQGNKINTEIFISDEKFQELKAKAGAPKFGDILITSVGTIGNTYLVKKTDEFYFKDGNLTWIKGYKKGFMPFYMKEWFKSQQAKDAIERIKIGTTQQAITIKALNGVTILNPDIMIIEIFEKQAISIFSKHDANIEQNDRLIKLRNTLLPKLISGELRLDSPQGEALQQAVSAE